MTATNCGNDLRTPWSTLSHGVPGDHSYLENVARVGARLEDACARRLATWPREQEDYRAMVAADALRAVARLREDDRAMIETLRAHPALESAQPLYKTYREVYLHREAPAPFLRMRQSVIDRQIADLAALFIALGNKVLAYDYDWVKKQLLASNEEPRFLIAVDRAMRLLRIVASGSDTSFRRLTFEPILPVPPCVTPDS